MGLVSVDPGKDVILDTSAGAVLKAARKDGTWGLGSLAYGGAPIGGSVSYFMRQDMFPVEYRADSVEVMNDDGERAEVLFHGVDKHFDFTVRIEIVKGVPAFLFRYVLTPISPLRTPLIVDLPFARQKMTFVQAPLVPPGGADWRGRYYLLPTYERVPFLLTRMQAGGNEINVGVGYHLKTDALVRGRIEHDSDKPHSLGVYFPYRDFAKHRAVKDIRYSMDFVVSLGASQAEAVKAYAHWCGFDTSSHYTRSFAEAVEGVYACYRNADKLYVKGKGYHFKIYTDTGEPCIKDYGRFLAPSYNPHIAWHLYEYWRAHKDERWARERAFESVRFYLDNQKENGAVPQLWESTTGRFRGFNIHHNEYQYNTCHLSIGSYGLLRFAEAVEREEGLDGCLYRDAALKAFHYLASRMGEDGKLGRSFDDIGNYDTLTPEAWALIALDHASAVPGGEDLAATRDRLERFTVETFVKNNRWMNWSSDGAWRGKGMAPENYDNFQPFTFAAYCMRRFARTQEQRYIDLAEHVFWYTWLGTIPAPIPGYKHVTKGLSFEQTYYQTYDIPYRACTLVDGLPLLSAATGNPFYVKYYAMLLQTQYYYQAIDSPYPSFYIGLWMPNKESDGNPMDELGEPRMAFTVEWPMMFLEAWRSPVWRDEVDIAGRIHDVNKPEA